MQAAMISDRYSELVGSKKSDDAIVDDYSRGARNRDGPEIEGSCIRRTVAAL
jgi:hypothetical protein